MADAPTLYQELLQERFEQLPEALRRFHDAPGGTAAGWMKVERGERFMQRMLAALMRLPSPGKRVRVELSVGAHTKGERWSRSFNGVPFTTEQWNEKGLLAERMGPMTILFAMEGGIDGMRFRYHRSRFLGIPVPPPLAFRVNAFAAGADKGWNIEVEISSPLFGLITRYHGLIVPNLDLRNS